MLPELMISRRAKSDWEKWKERLDASDPPPDPPSSIHDIQDTVGAVAWDADGGIAAGVSRQVVLVRTGASPMVY